MILGIYCAGGLGKEMLNLARYTNSVCGKWEDIVFIDDVVSENVIQGAAVWRWEDLLAHRDNTEVIIASGEPAGRKNLYEKLKAADVKIGTLIRPGATILPETVIEEGCIIEFCGISTQCHIAANTLVNSYATIGHNTNVGSHCYLGSNSFIGGKVSISDCVYAGPGAYIKDRIHIGEWAILSIGCVVFKSVKPERIMVGNPARTLGTNDDHSVFERFE